MAKKMSLVRFLRSDLVRRRKSLEASLLLVKSIEDYLLNKRKGFVFRVTLSSLWTNEGEKSICVEQQTSLKDIISLAVTRFKEINERSDIQADWCVSVVLSPDVVIPLPKEYWENLKK